MFDMEWEFDLELVIGSGEYATFSGVAGLVEDPGYGFTVSGITLHGNCANDHHRKCETQINARSPDLFQRVLFHKLEELLLVDRSASDGFDDALAKAHREAAA